MATELSDVKICFFRRYSLLFFYYILYFNPASKIPFPRPTKRSYTTMKYFPDSMSASRKDYISETLNSHAYYMPVNVKNLSQTSRPLSCRLLLAKKDDALIQRLENSIAAQARTKSGAPTDTVEETIMVPESTSLPESSALGEKKAGNWLNVLKRMTKGHVMAAFDCKGKKGSTRNRKQNC